MCLKNVGVEQTILETMSCVKRTQRRIEHLAGGTPSPGAAEIEYPDKGAQTYTEMNVDGETKESLLWAPTSQADPSATLNAA